MWKYQKNFNDVQVTDFKEIAELENKISGFDQSKSEETSEHTNKESDILYRYTNVWIPSWFHHLFNKAHHLEYS